MISVASCHKSYFSLVSYQDTLISSDVNVGVVAIDSWVALESSSLLIDVVVIVVLTCSSDSLVLSRDTLHGLVFFHIQSSSGWASSNFLTLVVGWMWCLVNLHMLDPKNTFLLLGGGQTCCSVIIDIVEQKNMFLSLEWIHTLCNCLMNLRSPPVITLYPGNWPRVISFITSAKYAPLWISVCNMFILFMGSSGNFLAADRMMWYLRISVGNGSHLYHFGLD